MPGVDELLDERAVGARAANRPAVDARRGEVAQQHHLGARDLAAGNDREHPARADRPAARPPTLPSRGAAARACADGAATRAPHRPVALAHRARCASGRRGGRSTTTPSFVSVASRLIAAHARAANGPRSRAYQSYIASSQRASRRSPHARSPAALPTCVTATSPSSTTRWPAARSPRAEVEIFDVHEPAFAVRRVTAERRRADHVHGADHPVDVDDAFVQMVGGALEPPRLTDAAAAPRERDEAHHRRQAQRRHPVHRTLQRAVGEEQRGATSPTSGCSRRNSTSARSEPGGGTVSGLSATSEVGRRRPRAPGSSRGRSPGSRGCGSPRTSRSMPREALDDRDAVVARRVVDDHDLGVEITERGRERLQARPEMARRVPGDDPHADFGHRPVTPVVRLLGLNP